MRRGGRGLGDVGQRDLRSGWAGGRGLEDGCLRDAGDSRAL